MAGTLHQRCSRHTPSDQWKRKRKVKVRNEQGHRSREPLGSHSDDGEEMTVDLEAATDEFRVAAMSLPPAMADDNNWSRLLFFFR